MAGLDLWDQALPYFHRALKAMASSSYFEPDTAFILERFADLATTADHRQAALLAWRQVSKIWRVLENPSQQARAEAAIDSLSDPPG